MKIDKYIEIFGAIELLKNRTELNNKYKRALANILAHEMGTNLDSCDPTVSCKIFDDIDKLLSRNVLGRKMSNNTMINDGFIHFTENVILSELRIISLNDIKDGIFDKLDKDTIKTIKEYLVNMILVSNDIIANKYLDVVNYIWDVYKLENPNKVDDNMNPSGILSIFIQVLTTATVKDASNLETLFLMKIKDISESARKTMSEMYKYMPSLFDHYFTGSNIFEK